MAAENPMNSFVEMFQQFGQNLKLPGPEINDVVDYHRKNIQALQDAAQASSAGAQALMNKQREALEASLADIAEMVQAAADPQKMMAGNSEVAKRSFETTIKNATEMTEIMRDSGAETFEILKARVEASIEELQGSMKKD